MENEKVSLHSILCPRGYSWILTDSKLSKDPLAYLSHNSLSMSKRDVKQLQPTICPPVYASYTVAQKLELSQLPFSLCCLYFYFIYLFFGFVHSFIHAHLSIYIHSIRIHLGVFFLALFPAPNCTRQQISILFTFWTKEQVGFWFLKGCTDPFKAMHQGLVEITTCFFYFFLCIFLKTLYRSTLTDIDIY